MLSYIAWNDWIDDIEIIWKEEFVASSKYYPSICLEGL
jgi:hypothetical protein